ncbi:MAG: 5'/3'-nucleotidase SurE, partial [Desulfurococcales archaeon]|nr:5'/3'-nucleotidase SurE [Desulfurococcales archaeon]
LSPGLYLLADVAGEFGEVFVSSTEYPRSASGREITFSRPLRYISKMYEGRLVHVTDGTPVDALHLAIEVSGFKPDLTLSGVNVGDNLSLQHIFYSGTLAVAIESALMGIPSVAFSADVMSFDDFRAPTLRELIKSVVGGVVKYVMRSGLPEGVDLLSVNIPAKFAGCAKVARAARIRWRAAYKEGMDPRGRKYFWLFGVKGEVESDSDVEAFEKGCVTITPLNINLNASKGLKQLTPLEDEVRRHIEGSLHGR